jgi:hypothetical protein
LPKRTGDEHSGSVEWTDEELAAARTKADDELWRSCPRISACTTRREWLRSTRAYVAWIFEHTVPLRWRRVREPVVAAFMENLEESATVRRMIQHHGTRKASRERREATAWVLEQLAVAVAEQLREVRIQSTTSADEVPVGLRIASHERPIPDLRSARSTLRKDRARVARVGPERQGDLKGRLASERAPEMLALFFALMARESRKHPAKPISPERRIAETVDFVLAGAPRAERDRVAASLCSEILGGSIEPGRIREMMRPVRGNPSRSIFAPTRT